MDIIIATDVDGTLTHESGLIDLDVVRVLRRLSDLGVKIILASSHAFPAVSTLAEYLGFKYLIAETGACGGHPWEPLFIERIPRYKDILDRLISHGFRPSLSNPYRLADISIYVPKNADPCYMINDVRNLLKDFDIDVFYSGYAIHIVKKGIDKGWGLRKLLDIMGVKGLIIAIGDGLNDVPLFDVADFSIAPSNAPELLKNHASVVLPYSFSEATLYALKNIEHLFKLRKFDLNTLKTVILK